MVYSALEALEIAAAHPERQVVFFAIGFETTTPATAHIILEAQSPRINQLQCLLQPCPDACGDPEHPRLARGP
jgi:hydrogenase expression/formation protein HypD